MELYSDRNPKKTIKGFGYKNKKKANYTLKKLKKIKATDLYSFQVINTIIEQNIIKIELKILKKQ